MAARTVLDHPVEHKVSCVARFSGGRLRTWLRVYGARTVGSGTVGLSSAATGADGQLGSSSAVGRSVVVVAVGKVLGDSAFGVVVLEVVALVVVVEHPGAEHRPQRVGTSRMVVPVNSSRPNSTPMNSSGAQIHGVSPSESGPPMTKPTNPAACSRSAGVSGEPAHRCHRPSTGSAIIAAPRTSRGLASGFGSVRINSTRNAGGDQWQQHHRRADEDAITESTQAPTGRAASNQELAAMITATPSKPSAMPSRRWPGSISRARPTDRAVLPVPLGQHQPRRAHGAPTGESGVVTNEWLRRRAGLRPPPRAAAGLRRPGTAPWAAFDLLFGSRNGRRSC